MKPSEKLHAQLIEKERTFKALDKQLKQLTGDDTVTEVSKHIVNPSTIYGSQCVYPNPSLGAVFRVGRRPLVRGLCLSDIYSDGVNILEHYHPVHVHCNVKVKGVKSDSGCPNLVTR